MLQFANALCDPPLGQTTSVAHGQDVVFSVVVESSQSMPDQPWEAVIWHDGHASREWGELPMRLINEGDGPLDITSKDRAKAFRRFFTVRMAPPMDVTKPVHFTLKYRTTASANWKWVNSDLALRDGELCFQSPKPPAELRDYLKDLSPDFSIHHVPSESPTAQLWSLTAPAKAAQGDVSAFTDTSLGLPRSYSRWFALVRTWSPWLAPRHGKQIFDCPQGAVLAAFLRMDGLHVVMLAISGTQDVLTELKPDPKGHVIAVSRNDRGEMMETDVLVAVAPTFDAANAACMYHARQIVKGDDFMSKEHQAEMKTLMAREVKAEWMENWYDGLTYCTWNALGQDLNEQKIYDALNILKDNKINITNLIIDDNWQTLAKTDGLSQLDFGWSAFEANKEGFPQGLKHTATKIRDDHPNIQHIAVWHAILGYWGAIDPNGPIAHEYKTKRVPREGGGDWTVVDPDDVDRMYDDFYKFLLESGIDSVKTDAQFELDQLHAAPDRRRMINKYQDAWTIAALRYFSIKAISCMSQFPQNLFHTQLPTNKPRFMVRNSDDFFPDIPSSHPYHVFTNAHNSLFTSHLNVLPDWDMFQTSHDYSGFHAAGRCISGGPIYITDYPGQHNVQLINEMTAPTTQGKTIILRPSTYGKTINVYTAYEEEALLRVGAFTGSKSTGTGLLAVFNVGQRSLSEVVNINSFPGVEPGEEYVVRAHTTGEISKSMTLDSEMPVVSLEVGVKGYEILSAYPLQVFDKTKVAVLGLLGKMTGAAAVTSKTVQMEGNGRLKAEISVKALGVIGLYVSTLEEKTVKGNVLATMAGQVIPLDCVKQGADKRVLEIDVEQAWTELGLKTGYSNDVVAQVMIT